MNWSILPTSCVSRSGCHSCCTLSGFAGAPVSRRTARSFALPTSQQQATFAAGTDHPTSRGSISDQGQSYGSSDTVQQVQAPNPCTVDSCGYSPAYAGLSMPWNSQAHPAPAGCPPAPKRMQPALALVPLQEVAPACLGKVVAYL